MLWSDIRKPPSDRILRQFSCLWLLFFAGAGGWRSFHGDADAVALAMVVAGLGMGGLGLARPRLMKYVFMSWMIAAFPIGRTVSTIVLGLVFFILFTPIALVFRLMGRDALHVRGRGRADSSYWADSSTPESVESYLRQS